eukprot:gene1634-12759_t
MDKIIEKEDTFHKIDEKEEVEEIQEKPKIEEKKKKVEQSWITDENKLKKIESTKLPKGVFDLYNYQTPKIELKIDERHPSCREYGVKRDFKNDPIIIFENGLGMNVRNLVQASPGKECDVKCYTVGHQPLDYKHDGFLHGGGKKCPYQKTISLTMENVGRSNYDIEMNTRLDSDVPAGYYSWIGHNFYQKMVEKTGSALATAYISNCNARSGRDSVVTDLQKYGIKVESYGRCNRNAQSSIPKVINMAKYKFHLAFENSKTDDYITEKYFQCIETGTVPVYIGAPNIREYEPQPGSVLVASDFPDTKSLAKEMIRLSKNKKDYDKMLNYKKIGFSDKFKSVVDISTVHSYCRLCIKLADQYIRDNGLLVSHDSAILVRERNTFYFRPIELNQIKTLKDLKQNILKVFKDYEPVWSNQRPGYVKGKPLKIFRIHKAGVKMKESLFGFSYDSNEKVKKMKAGDQIEVIFV